jgi:hypothetical protein
MDQGQKIVFGVSILKYREDEPKNNDKVKELTLIYK